MKGAYKLAISVSAAIGFTVLMISVTAMIKAILFFMNGKSEKDFWEVYLKGFSMSFHYSIYLYPTALVFFVLVYMLPLIRKKQTHA